MSQGELSCVILFSMYVVGTYHKVASSNISCSEAHAGFFRLLMNGIFDSYVLRPFDKKFIFFN